MRDEFSAATKDLLAKRVGYHCSNPECQRPTIGPQQDASGAVNVGVGAHITAASTGGPRYDASLSPEQRCDSTNGIWLCQTCAKLVDNDPVRYDRVVLEGWKRAAERAALVAIVRGRHGAPAPQTTAAMPFAKIERLMPALLEEMREDLVSNPTAREFVVLKKGWVYPSSGHYLAYYLDEHDDLAGKLQILENHRFISDVTRKNVQRFRFGEEFVDYLTNS
jgi:hypothetical protein